MSARGGRLARRRRPSCRATRAAAAPVVEILEELMEADVVGLMMLFVAGGAAEDGGEEAVRLKGQVIAAVRLGEQVGHEQVV